MNDGSDHGRETTSAVSRLVPALARIGYGGRGVVYLAAGGFSLLAALTAETEPVGPLGALRRLLNPPFGWLWPLLFGIGFLCFALWRLIEALVDVDGLGTGWSALRIRAGYVFASLGNLGLALASGALALGLLAPEAKPGRFVRGAVGAALMQPAGAWLVLAVGLATASLGLAFVWRGLRGVRIGEFLPSEAPQRVLVARLGRIGFTARGFAFALAGGYLIAAGWLGRADPARGVAGALESIASRPFGWIALAAIAFGFLAFGFFSLAQAFLRRIGSGRAPDDRPPP